MAFITASITPETLGFGTTVRVIIPETGEASGKIIYLLHGIANDSGTWTRFSRIESYAEARGYTVIMPEAQRSFYIDMKNGAPYFTYVTDELPRICEYIFSIKHTHDKTFIGGFSMGGYGALLCALTKPDFYGGVCSFSGSVDMGRRLRPENTYWTKETNAIYGEGERQPDDNDIAALFVRLNALPAEKRPRIYMTCGKQDDMIKENRVLQDKLKSLSVDVTYEEWDGAHNFDFWDESVKKALEFFDAGIKTNG